MANWAPPISTVCREIWALEMFPSVEPPSTSERLRYKDFLRRHKHGKTLYLELGVGTNTPVIIKYPFWKYTHENPKAVYACLNLDSAYALAELSNQSICINGDIENVLDNISDFSYPDS